MNFNHWFITYNGMASNHLVQLAGSYLLQGTPRSLGSAIKTFEFYPHIKTRAKALPTLGGMKEEFAPRLALLEAKPRVAFLRRWARFDISYVSKLGDEEELVPRDREDGEEPAPGPAKRDPREALKLFRAAAQEIASTLLLARTRLKKSDGFDWDRFARHLEDRLAALPESPKDLGRVLEQAEKPGARQAQKTSAVEPSARALKRKPKLVAIDHDDHHASHVGKCADGAQFFLTTPFVPAEGGPGREFVALYIFERDGRLREARIDDLGPRASLDAERASALFARRFAELGPVKLGRIRIQPFQVKRYKTVFGLIPELLDDGSDDWCVQVEPGNYMAFFKPWGSGDYDT